MKIKPVRSKAVARYPSQDYLREHPELLCFVPQRWQQNALVLRVLGGVVCLVLAGQTSAAGQQAAGAPESRIAPLFVHGAGRGTFGCMAINPPVFLSEDEARQVIQEEAKKAGLEFAQGAPTISDAVVSAFDYAGCPPQGQIARPPKLEITLDGFHQRHKIAYEFVSMQDTAAWETKKPGCRSSAASVDFRGTAEAFRRGIDSSPELPWLGVFYEPAARASPEKSGKQIDAEELRKQVRDFVQWLKAQGVI